MAEYFRVRRGDRLHGPYSREELSEHLLAQTFGANDKVSRNEGPWMTVTELVELEARESTQQALPRQTIPYYSVPSAAPEPPTQVGPPTNWPQAPTPTNTPAAPADSKRLLMVGGFFVVLVFAMMGVLILVVTLRSPAPVQITVNTPGGAPATNVVGGPTQGAAAPVGVAKDSPKAEPSAEPPARPVDPPRAAPEQPRPAVVAGNPEKAVALLCEVIRNGNAVTYHPLYTAWAVDKRVWISRANLWATRSIDVAVHQGKMDLHAITSDREFVVNRLVFHPKLPVAKMRDAAKLANADLSLALLNDVVALFATEDTSEVLMIAKDGNLDAVRATGRPLRILHTGTVAENVDARYRPTILTHPTSLKPFVFAPKGHPSLSGFNGTLSANASGSPLLDHRGEVVGLAVSQVAEGRDLTRMLSVDRVRELLDHIQTDGANANK